MKFASRSTTLWCLLAAACTLLAVPAVSPAQTVTAPAPESGAAQNGEEISTYVISPLDRLLIVVYAGDKQTGEYQKFVQSDGAIYLPYLEQDVKIGGLMLLEAEKKLEELSRRVILEPRVVITVMSSFSQSVSTYGKIKNETVQLNTPMRILQLIARVGGPMDSAIEDSIRVISTDGSVRFFDFRKVNRNPDDENNFLLKPGDIIYVPGANDFSVKVFGEVKNTGTYQMRNGDRLLDALLMAKSWSSDAEIRKVRLLRTYARGRTLTWEVDLNKIFNNTDSNLNYPLQDGDMIFVPTKGPSRLQPMYMVFSTISILITTYAIIYNIQH